MRWTLTASSCLYLSLLTTTTTSFSPGAVVPLSSTSTPLRHGDARAATTSLLPKQATRTRRPYAAGPLFATMEELAKEWAARNRDVDGPTAPPPLNAPPPAAPQPKAAAAPAAPPAPAPEKKAQPQPAPASPPSPPPAAAAEKKPKETKKEAEPTKGAAAAAASEAKETKSKEAPAKKEAVAAKEAAPKKAPPKKEPAVEAPPKVKNASVTAASRVTKRKDKLRSNTNSLIASFFVSLGLVLSLPFVIPKDEDGTVSINTFVPSEQQSRLEEKYNLEKAAKTKKGGATATPTLKAYSNTPTSATPPPFKRLEPKSPSKTLKSFQKPVTPGAESTKPDTTPQPFPENTVKPAGGPLTAIVEPPPPAPVPSPPKAEETATEKPKAEAKAAAVVEKPVEPKVVQKEESKPESLKAKPKAEPDVVAETPKEAPVEKEAPKASVEAPQAIESTSEKPNEAVSSEPVSPAKQPDTTTTTAESPTKPEPVAETKLTPPAPASVPVPAPAPAPTPASSTEAKGSDAPPPSSPQEELTFEDIMNNKIHK